MRHLPVCFFLVVFGHCCVADDTSKTVGPSLPIATNSIGMKFVTLPAGSFLMGVPEYVTDVKGAERPEHNVQLTTPFHIGVYEVTQKQYKRVMKSNPSAFQHPDHPVENVRWIDAVKFCETLSSFPEEVKSGYAYHLPSEMEWEYACRAGRSTHYHFGDDPAQLKDFAWFEENSDRQTHPVGQKKPNAWGLYDMHGNVREWCRGGPFSYKRYAHGRVVSNGQLEPWIYAPRNRVVYRSGSWSMPAKRCYSAYRMMSGWGDSVLRNEKSKGTLGFRVIRIRRGS